MTQVARSDFPPALQLLCKLLRSGLGTDTDNAAGSLSVEPPVVHWATFVGLVERHRVAAFLHRRCGTALTAACPEPVVKRIHALAFTNTRRALTVAALQLDLMQRLTADGLDVTTLKGVVLAQQLHGGPGGRHVGDIDLVVTPENVARADAIIQTAGCRRTRPGFVLSPRQTAEYLRLKPEFEYVHPDGNIRVELLWRLEGLPSLDLLGPGLITCRTLGRTMRTLPSEPNALYLLQHGARHGWFRLFWLIDIALLFQSPTVDWEAVAALARRDGGLRSLWQGATLAGALLGVRVPPALQPPAHARRRNDALVAEACRQIARPVTADETRVEWFRQTYYRSQLPDTRRGRLGALAPHFFSPLNWQTLSLPDRWFFLYSYLSPFLWLWRSTRRGGWSR